MSAPGPLDSGLQSERTDLAWRRTMLALLVGGILALRFLPPVLGAWSLGASFAGLAVAGVMWVLARSRARLTHEALQDPSVPLPGAGLLLALALLVAGGAAMALLYVVERS
jgi:uncharacterized membrane protein YidH (DUF202 family)